MRERDRLMGEQTCGQSTSFHHPSCPLDHYKLSRLDAWSSCLPEGPKSWFDLNSLILVTNSEYTEFSGKGFVASFPPGLLVEISDGECGCRRPGAGADWKLSWSSPWNEWPHSSSAEEAASAPKTTHAPRGGAGGALQCGTGEWLQRREEGTHMKTAIMFYFQCHFSYDFVLEVCIAEISMQSEKN